MPLLFTIAAIAVILAFVPGAAAAMFYGFLILAGLLAWVWLGEEWALYRAHKLRERQDRRRNPEQE